jgi:N-acetylneuraminic acid mutarotase
MKTIIDTSKAIILIACIIALSHVEGWGANAWQPQRIGATGFSIGSKGYIGTGYGYGKGYIYMKDFWEYNPATDSWTQKADFSGTARSWAIGFSLGSKGYIGTGKTSSGYTKDFWEYNPVNNTWTKKADFGGIPRQLATGFSINTALINRGYIGTGGNGGSNPINLKDFWEYNPVTNIWLQKADFPGIARYAAVGFSISGKGYLGTGINYVSSTENTIYNDLYEYNPGENTWTRKADLGGSARAFAVGFCIGGMGYIGTGNSSEGFLKDFWEYNPTVDAWIEKASFGGAERDCATGFSIGTNGYIGTGLLSDNSYTKDFWEYNQSTNVWTRKTDFGSKHKGSLKDGPVIGEPDQLSSKELMVYPNPSNSTFKFRLETTSEESVTIQVFDMSGRLVHEYKSLSPDDIMTIGEDLNVGVYIAVVTQGEYRKTIKINKVH